MIALQNLPHVQVILSDEEKTICSVKITVARTERIDSGSMMFHHPRYITFGQTVVFTDKDVAEDQSGALFFKVSSELEALDIIDNIGNYVEHSKDKPNDSAIIEEVM